MARRSPTGSVALADCRRAPARSPSLRWRGQRPGARRRAGRACRWQARHAPVPWPASPSPRRRPGSAERARARDHAAVILGRSGGSLGWPACAGARGLHPGGVTTRKCVLCPADVYDQRTSVRLFVRQSASPDRRHFRTLLASRTIWSLSCRDPNSIPWRPSARVTCQHMSRVAGSIGARSHNPARARRPARDRPRLWRNARARPSRGLGGVRPLRHGRERLIRGRGRRRHRARPDPPAGPLSENRASELDGLLS